MTDAEIAITVMSYSSVLLTVIATTTKRGAQYVKALGIRPDVLSLLGIMVGCSYYGAKHGFEASILKQMVSLFLTVFASGTLVPYVVERICSIIKKDAKSCGVTLRLSMSIIILVGLIVLDTYLGEFIIAGLGETPKEKKKEKVLYVDTMPDDKIRSRFHRELRMRGLEVEDPESLGTTLDATAPPN